MSQQMIEDAVIHTVTAPAPAYIAFAVFTHGFATWWPASHTRARAALDTVIIEPREGGRWFERGLDGAEYDWGRVFVWDPPRRLVLSCRPDPEHDGVPWRQPRGLREIRPSMGSEIDVRFVAEGPWSTRVSLEHRDFSRLGDDGGHPREVAGSAAEWTLLLNRYAAATL